MGDFFGGLNNGIQGPQVVMNQGPLPPMSTAGYPYTLDGQPNARINYGSSLLGDLEPYTYAEADLVANQTLYQNVPNRIQKIVPILSLPGTSRGQYEETFMLTHAVDDGDVAFVIRENSPSVASSTRVPFRTVEPTGARELEKIYSHRNYHPLINLPTVNYLLAGLQYSMLDDASPTGNGLTLLPDSWDRLRDSFNVEFWDRRYWEDADTVKMATERLAIDLVQNSIMPFGVMHGSEKQGGGHEANLSPVTWASNFVSTFYIEGFVRNMCNAWRENNMSSGDYLVFKLEPYKIDDCQRYVLNHYPKAQVTKVFDVGGIKQAFRGYNAAWGDVIERPLIWQLCPRIISGFSRSLRCTYWRIAMTYTRRMRMVDLGKQASKVMSCDASLLNGPVLEAAFQPVFQSYASAWSGSNYDQTSLSGGGGQAGTSNRSGGGEGEGQKKLLPPRPNPTPPQPNPTPPQPNLTPPQPEPKTKWPDADEEERERRERRERMEREDRERRERMEREDRERRERREREELERGERDEEERRRRKAREQSEREGREQRDREEKERREREDQERAEREEQLRKREERVSKRNAKSKKMLEEIDQLGKTLKKSEEEIKKEIRDYKPPGLERLSEAEIAEFHRLREPDRLALLVMPKDEDLTTNPDWYTKEGEEKLKEYPIDPSDSEKVAREEMQLINIGNSKVTVDVAMPTAIQFFTNTTRDVRNLEGAFNYNVHVWERSGDLDLFEQIRWTLTSALVMLAGFETVETAVRLIDLTEYHDLKDREKARAKALFDTMVRIKLNGKIQQLYAGVARLVQLVHLAERTRSSVLGLHVNAPVDLKVWLKCSRREKERMSGIPMEFCGKMVNFIPSYNEFGYEDYFLMNGEELEYAVSYSVDMVKFCMSRVTEEIEDGGLREAISDVVSKATIEELPDDYSEDGDHAVGVNIAQALGRLFSLEGFGDSKVFEDSVSSLGKRGCVQGGISGGIFGGKKQKTPGVSGGLFAGRSVAGVSVGAKKTLGETAKVADEVAKVDKVADEVAKVDNVDKVAKVDKVDKMDVDVSAATPGKQPATVKKRGRVQGSALGTSSASKGGSGDGKDGKATFFDVF